MMRNDSATTGIDKFSLAVRKSDGEIELEVWENSEPKRWYRRTPFVRGIFNFISMLRVGYKTLMRSADLAGFEEEPSAFEKRLQEKLGDKFSTLFNAVVLVLGLLLAVGLFMVLPASVSYLLKGVIHSTMLLTILEGVLKIAIFICYLAAVSHMQEIKRVFQYHGAEHKTIFCYEHGEELTVENVKKYPRFHPRCGTSFLLIVLVLSIIVFSVITWNSLPVRIALKLLLLPVVVGISYEVIKFAGRHDNLFTRIISKPGLWLQRFTTNEPDDSQIEVGIAAMKAVIPESRANARIKELIDEGSALLAQSGVDSPRFDATQLLLHCLGVDSPAELFLAPPPSPEQQARYCALLRRRAGREPLQYLLGFWEFYGRRFHVRECSSPARIPSCSSTFHCNFSRQAPRRKSSICAAAAARLPSPSHWSARTPRWTRSNSQPTRWRCFGRTSPCTARRWG